MPGPTAKVLVHDLVQEALSCWIRHIDQSMKRECGSRWGASHKIIIAQALASWAQFDQDIEYRDDQAYGQSDCCQSGSGMKIRKRIWKHITNLYGMSGQNGLDCSEWCNANGNRFQLSLFYDIYSDSQSELSRRLDGIMARCWLFMMWLSISRPLWTSGVWISLYQQAQDFAGQAWSLLSMMCHHLFCQTTIWCRSIMYNQSDVISFLLSRCGMLGRGGWLWTRFWSSACGIIPMICLCISLSLRLSSISQGRGCFFHIRSIVLCYARDFFAWGRVKSRAPMSLLAGLAARAALELSMGGLGQRRTKTNQDSLCLAVTVKLRS